MSLSMKGAFKQIFKKQISIMDQPHPPYLMHLSEQIELTLQ